MKTLLLVAASSAIVLAAPARAQSVDHAMMPGMTMPTPKAPTKAKPATRPAAKPKPKPRRQAPVHQAPKLQKLAPAADLACPPEHAAMGHCTPKPTAASVAPVPPVATDSSCSSEHAAMGHCAPQSAAAQAPAPTVTDPACPPEHAAMGHCTPSAVAASPVMPGPARAGTALTAGDAPAPAATEPNYADRVWGRAAMAPTRAALYKQHGSGTFSQIMFNLAEYQVRDGRDGYRWDGEGWFGGDVDRFVVKSEGSGSFGNGIEDAEIQALYSRAIGPYFNVQAGMRHDFRPSPSRTYATVGFEGLAPYWFEVEGALFLSDKGDVLARLEGYYDQRLTQRLILQPRAELNLSAQDVRENGIGSGLSDIELGLRLRYEVAREFAPYIGVSWDRKLGTTARLARAAGEDPSSPSVVLGIRVWF